MTCDGKGSEFIRGRLSSLYRESDPGRRYRRYAGIWTHLQPGPGRYGLQHDNYSQDRETGVRGRLRLP